MVTLRKKKVCSRRKVIKSLREQERKVHSGIDSYKRRQSRQIPDDVYDSDGDKRLQGWYSKRREHQDRGPEV